MNIIMTIETTINYIDNINLDEEKLEKRKSERLLHEKFEKMLKTLKIRTITKKNGESYIYYVCEYLRNVDLNQRIKMQDIIDYVIKYKKDLNKAETKRPLSDFLNIRTDGYWESKQDRKVDPAKYYKFNPQINDAIINQTGGTHFNKKIKKKLLERANNKCELCYNSGTKKNLHADHWNNRAGGGNGTFENGVILCQQCNNGKKDKNPDKVLYDIAKTIDKLSIRSGTENPFVKAVIELYHQYN